MGENRSVPSIKAVTELMKMMQKLEPQEFLGICTILGVKIYEEDLDGEVERTSFAPDQVFEGNELSLDESEGTMAPAGGHIHAKDDANLHKTAREGSELVRDVMTAIMLMNRTQRRNLKKLLKSATKRK